VADIFENEIVEKNPNEDLVIVYVLYFDEKRGQNPLLIYPDDNLRKDKKYMRPIHYHPVWFLESEELDHIDLEFKGYTFFGKKFLAKSERQKRRAGFKVETPETIVIIVSLPVEIEIFGDDLIRKLSTEIREKFEDQLYKIIKSEIASENVIKSQKILERIEEGKKIKIFLRELIDKTIKHYFSKIIKKKTDSTSIKAQKAISYFSMKGFEFSPLSSLRGKDTFSDIELFDPQKKSVDDLKSKPPLSINSINFIENSQEIEIMVQNNKEEELKNISIVISHVKEYFEKEIMSQVVDDWYPGEELLFISPIVPHIDEYLISIKKGDSKEEDQTFFTQRIDLKLIDKIES